MDAFAFSVKDFTDAKVGMFTLENWPSPTIICVITFIFQGFYYLFTGKVVIFFLSNNDR